MFQPLLNHYLSRTQPPFSFSVDCGAINPFPMTSSDLLSVGVMLMPCDRNHIILLTQVIQEKLKQSEGLSLLMHLISLSVGS